jgi:GTP-binding protein
MIVKSAEFIKSAVKPSHYPPAALPEIAFAGRSNVGKSSLINVLVNRKRLAKTGATPGRTQLINFFNINSAFTFVDIPGFGYAKVPVSVKKKWGPMVETYLSTRKTLKGVVLIMDIRRTPGLEELSLVEWLNHYQIFSIMVVTKIDKLSRSKQLVQKQKIAQALGINSTDLILFSARTRQGKGELWRAIQALVGAEDQ